MKTTMHAMLLREPQQALRLVEMPVPTPAADQVLLRVEACGVCRTDLHIVDGELAVPHLPIIPGHQIVGQVAAKGSAVRGLRVGQRVGVPWLAGTCGACYFCTSGSENLCDQARFTGFHLHGGFAEYTVADAHFCFPMGEGDAAHTAPLLCAGLIGYRALSLVGDAHRVGIYGFGAAAHIITQVAISQGRTIYAFTRQGDTANQAFARDLGAAWAGASGEAPPQEMEAAIIFAPVGELVPIALGQVEKGGTVVCAGIHMSDIPSFPYHLLWGERSLRSVSNLARADGKAFLELAASVPVHTEVRTYPLERANDALADVRRGTLQGAAVLLMG